MIRAHGEKVRSLEGAEESARARCTELEGELQRTAETHLDNIAKQEQEHQVACQALRNTLEERDVAHTAQVAQLESEMRAILHQSNQLKLENDAKMSKLAGALGEFTNFLQPK
eukprot:sb/3476971/